VPSLACADTPASYTVLLHFSMFASRTTADNQATWKSINWPHVRSTHLCSADPRRFLPPLFYSTVVLLFCIICPRVPLPLRSRLWTSDQRLLLRPSYYPFSCPSRHHIRTSIATSPPLILRAMLNISALQQRACYDLYSRLAIDHDHQRHYSSRTSHAYSQSRLAVSSSHLTFDGKLTFFGLMKRFLARVYGRIFLCFSPRLCPAGWLVRLHALWRILSRWIVHKVPFWLEYVCELLEC
jgi:hypothetical protein